MRAEFDRIEARQAFPRPNFEQYRPNDLFVAEREEEAYLARHGIEARRLPNGAELYGLQKPGDTHEASIEIRLPYSAYFEPKKGITHLLEHILASKISRDGAGCQAFHNASTSIEGLRFTLAGTANPDVPEYGLWTMLPFFVSNLTEPFQVQHGELEAEKGVVRGELQESESKDRASAGVKKIIFGETHPFSYYVGGSRESVDAISAPDISEHWANVLNPKGLKAVVLSHGDPRIMGQIMTALEKGLAKLPKKGIAPEKITDEAFCKVNPDFENGKIYTHDTGERDGLVQVNYLWQTPRLRTSAYDVAKIIFFNSAFDKFHAYFRQRGLGYSAEKVDVILGSRYHLLGFSMMVPKESDPAGYAIDLYPHIRQEVFGGFGHPELSRLGNQLNLRARAEPNSREDRIAHVLAGIEHHGRIIDPDRLSEVRRSIGVPLLRQRRDEFADSMPAMVITGDLGRPTLSGRVGKTLARALG